MYSTDYCHWVRRSGAGRDGRATCVVGASHESRSMSGRGDGDASPPLFLATADVQHGKQAHLPVPDAGRQPQRRPHKKKAQGKKRKRARRALRLNLRPQIDKALPVLARLHEGHAPTPHSVVRAAQSRFGSTFSACAEIDWAALPAELNPLAGKVPPARAERKRRQIESLLHWACRLLPPPPIAAHAEYGPVVIDFCAGGGHLGLVLAALRPDITMVLLDVKQPALAGAQQRARAMGLKNVQTFCGAVGEYRAPFDLALALHSCGGAADAVQTAAIAAGAGYVIAPCCYGFIQAAAEECSSTHGEGIAGTTMASTDAKLLLVADLQYPRSAGYRGVDTLSTSVYAAIAGSADATYWPSDSRAGEHDTLARDCMDAIDRDRTLLAAEAGYTAAFTTMDMVHANNEETKSRENKETADGQKETFGGQSSGHGSGLKNQLLVGWRYPTRSTVHPSPNVGTSQ